MKRFPLAWIVLAALVVSVPAFAGTAQSEYSGFMSRAGFSFFFGSH